MNDPFSLRHSWYLHSWSTFHLFPPKTNFSSLHVRRNVSNVSREAYARLEMGERLPITCRCGHENHENVNHSLSCPQFSSSMEHLMKEGEEEGEEEVFHLHPHFSYLLLLLVTIWKTIDQKQGTRKGWKKKSLTHILNGTFSSSKLFLFSYFCSYFCSYFFVIFRRKMKNFFPFRWLISTFRLQYDDYDDDDVLLYSIILLIFFATLKWSARKRMSPQNMDGKSNIQLLIRTFKNSRRRTLFTIRRRWRMWRIWTSWRQFLNVKIMFHIQYIYYTGWTYEMWTPINLFTWIIVIVFHVSFSIFIFYSYS